MVGFGLRGVCDGVGFAVGLLGVWVWVGFRFAGAFGLRVVCEWFASGFGLRVVCEWFVSGFGLRVVLGLFWFWEWFGSGFVFGEGLGGVWCCVVVC